MKKIVQGFGMLSVVAAATMSVPGQAAADDNLYGQYTLDVRGASYDWTMSPCADADPNGFIPCVRVSQSGGDLQPWAADAALSVGSWTLRVNRLDAIGCEDGSTHPGETTYSWDAVTGKGNVSVYNPGVCGGDPQTIGAYFDLIRK
ncbi:hypothetical protein [Mycolicibacterium sediminis]|nr:hypothetical protein [Mycolicibacterium sediminis]